LSIVIAEIVAAVFLGEKMSITGRSGVVLIGLRAVMVTLA